MPRIVRFSILESYRIGLVVLSYECTYMDV